MFISFDADRPSSSPFIERVWSCRSTTGGPGGTNLVRPARLRSRFKMVCRIGSHSRKRRPGLARNWTGCNLRVVSESFIKFGLDKLDVDQRLALIEEIWNSIDADDSAAVLLSDAQRAELRARVLEDDENPDDVVSWENIKRAASTSSNK